MIWTFADQALSSLANFALSIVVAREVSASEFGSFSLMLVTFTFLIGLGKAVIGDPYVIRFTDADLATRRRASRQATGAAIAFGVLAGLLCSIASIFLDRASAMGILGLGIAMPGLMLQETWRSAFFAEGRPRTATINDGVRTLIQFMLLGVLITTPSPSVFLITLAWGAGGFIAAMIGILQTRVMPNPFEAMDWYHETRDINVKMGLDFSFNQGSTTLATYAVTGIVGNLAIGAIRAAQSLLGPLNLLFSGISSFGLPVLTRTALSGRSLVKQALLLSAAIGGMASMWLLVLLVVPTSIGRQVLGDSWDTARAVMLPMGLVTCTVGFVLGASLALKALRRADQMLRVTLVQAPLMLGLGAGMGALWSAQGAAWGFAIAQLTGFVICWAIFLRADRLPRDWITTAAQEFDREPQEPRGGVDPRTQGPTGQRRPQPGFWDQQEQNRWALEEPEQLLFTGQLAEQRWEPEEHQLPRRPRAAEPAAQGGAWPRQGAEPERPAFVDEPYDPRQPTVAVQQDRYDPRHPTGAAAQDGYDPRQPTVAVRQETPNPGPRTPSPWQGPATAPTPAAGWGRSGPQRHERGSGSGRGRFDPDARSDDGRGGAANPFGDGSAGDRHGGDRPGDGWPGRPAGDPYAGGPPGGARADFAGGSGHPSSRRSGDRSVDERESGGRYWVERSPAGQYGGDHNPRGQYDPDAYGRDRGADPYGSDPYGADPYGADPYGSDVYRQDQPANDRSARDPRAAAGFEERREGDRTYADRPGSDAIPPAEHDAYGYGYEDRAVPDRPPQRRSRNRRH